MNLMLYVRVPAGGAEFMNLKLQQLAAQTRRLSRRKECSEDGDGSPSGSDVTALTCLQIPGQDKAEIRTACSVVEGSKDTSISYNVCASPTMAENAESVIIPKDSETETWKDQDSVPAVTDVKQASMAVSEGLEMMELGMDCSSKETVVEHVAEYRSPLEHFHSKRQGIELEVGTM